MGMHGWFTIFSGTEFWSRFSSSPSRRWRSTAGVVVLGRQFGNRTYSVLCGSAFRVLLPRITW